MENAVKERLIFTALNLIKLAKKKALLEIGRAKFWNVSQPAHHMAKCHLAG